jgi:hypothetical protein
MRLAIGVSACVLVLAAASATLSAEEPASVDLQAALSQPHLQAAALDFMPGASAGQPRGAARGEDEHLFGLGVRTGGNSLGIGFSVRSWFMPHWGAQVGVTHYSYGDFFGYSFSSTEFAPAVLYGFDKIKLDANAPLSLRPFAGVGISSIRSSYAFSNNLDTTNTGILLLGGVELFFKKVPKLGVSGELEFTPSTSPFSSVSSVGGAGFVASGHWYFK